MHLWFQKQIVRHCVAASPILPQCVYLSLSHLKYRYLHRPHKRPNLHPSEPEQPAEQFSSCINAFTERRGIFCRALLRRRWEKSSGQTFQISARIKKAIIRWPTMSKPTALRPSCRGKRRGLFLITDIYFRTVFSASPISAAANGFHACGFQSSEFSSAVPLPPAMIAPA